MSHSAGAEISRVCAASCNRGLYAPPLTWSEWVGFLDFNKYKSAEYLLGNANHEQKHL